MYKCIIWSNNSCEREYTVKTRSAMRAAIELGRCDGGEVVQIPQPLQFLPDLSTTPIAPLFWYSQILPVITKIPGSWMLVFGALWILFFFSGHNVAPEMIFSRGQFSRSAACRGDDCAAGSIVYHGL